MRRFGLLLFVLLAVGAGVVYGGWAYQSLRFPFDGSVPGLESGQMRQTKARFRPAAANAQPTGTQGATNLSDLGYAEGSTLASSEAGVTRHDTERAWPGLNLYTSGHAEEAYLVDMDGQLLHTWSYDLAAELPEDEAKTLRKRFRRAQVMPDGSLLAVYGGHAWLAKFDKDSNLLWKTFGGYHHDFDVRPDGKIYAIGSEAHVVERIHPKRPVIEDFIVILSPEGKELDRLSVLEAFENSEFRPMLAQMPAYGDILHTNTIEVLGEPHPNAPKSWKAGQVLISVREMDTIAVIDLTEGRVVWARTGMWDAQHQPTVLDDGNLLLFDNYGTGMSRVIEFEPRGMDIVWNFQGDEQNGFYSETCGSSIRLPNGNTLITESDSGRAFEVTRGGNEVWRYVSPHRAGDQGELVATLFEVLRYPLDYLEPGVLED